MRHRSAGGRARAFLLAVALAATGCSSLSDFQAGGDRFGSPADAQTNDDGTNNDNSADGATIDGDASDDGAAEDPSLTDDPSIAAPDGSTGEAGPEDGDDSVGGDTDNGDGNAADLPDDPSIADAPEGVDPAPEEANAGADLPPVEVLRLEPRVIGTYPHDSGAFTQGLEFDGNTLLESTGLYGESTRRQTAPGSGRIIASEALGADEFGQGLTVHNGNLIQLTWKEGEAIVANPADLSETSRIAYDREGWGICSLGDRIVTSDGTDRLQYRDPASLLVIAELAVTLDGEPVTNLNELECIDGAVWANVWLTSDIVQIDAVTGQVTTVIDASGIVPTGLGEEDVLNGIALHRTSRTMFVTGKRWGVMYEIEFPFEDAG